MIASPLSLLDIKKYDWGYPFLRYSFSTKYCIAQMAQDVGRITITIVLTDLRATLKPAASRALTEVPVRSAAESQS